MPKSPQRLVTSCMGVRYMVDVTSIAHVEMIRHMILCAPDAAQIFARHDDYYSHIKRHESVLKMTPIGATFWSASIAATVARHRLLTLLDVEMPYTKEDVKRSDWGTALDSFADLVYDHPNDNGHHRSSSSTNKDNSGNEKPNDSSQFSVPIEAQYRVGKAISACIDAYAKSIINGINAISKMIGSENAFLFVDLTPFMSVDSSISMQFVANVETRALAMALARSKLRVLTSCSHLA